MALQKNKYQVAEGDSLDELQMNVTELMAQGFIPCGGVTHFIIEANGGTWPRFIQAMWEPVAMGGGASSAIRVGSGWGGGGSAGGTREA